MTTVIEARNGKVHLEHAETDRRWATTRVHLVMEPKAAFDVANQLIAEARKAVASKKSNGGQTA